MPVFETVEVQAQISERKAKLNSDKFTFDKDNWMRPQVLKVHSKDVTGSSSIKLSAKGIKAKIIKQEQ